MSKFGNKCKYHARFGVASLLMRNNCLLFWLQGDSGGPLTIIDDDNQVTQIGIVSFGISLSCENVWPTAFTRLTKYFAFIESNSDVKIRD